MGGEGQGSASPTGMTGGYQGQSFLGGLPIIGNLLNGASKNPGAGSTMPPQSMSIMDQPGASMFASIFGPGPSMWGQ